MGRAAAEIGCVAARATVAATGRIRPIHSKLNLCMAKVSHGQARAVPRCILLLRCSLAAARCGGRGMSHSSVSLGLSGGPASQPNFRPGRSFLIIDRMPPAGRFGPTAFLPSFHGRKTAARPHRGSAHADRFVRKIIPRLGGPSSGRRSCVEVGANGKNGAS